MKVWLPSSNSSSRWLIEHVECSFQNVKMKTINHSMGNKTNATSKERREPILQDIFLMNTLICLRYLFLLGVKLLSHGKFTLNYISNYQNIFRKYESQLLYSLTNTCYHKFFLILGNLMSV